MVEGGVGEDSGVWGGKYTGCDVKLLIGSDHGYLCMEILATVSQILKCPVDRSLCPGVQWLTMSQVIKIDQVYVSSFKGPEFYSVIEVQWFVSSILKLRRIT